MPHVNVGGSRCRVSRAEYAAAMIEKDTTVYFSLKNGQSGCGIFRGCWFYDCVVANVKVGERSVSVFPSLGDRIRRAKAHEVADHVGGEGI